MDLADAGSICDHLLRNDNVATLVELAEANKWDQVHRVLDDKLGVGDINAVSDEVSDTISNILRANF